MDKIDQEVTSSQETASLEVDGDVLMEDIQEFNGKTQPKLNVNCAEKIVLMLDVSGEMNETIMHDNEGAPKRSRLDWAKKCLQMFVLTKSSLNSSNEFALAILQSESLIWLLNFTSNPNALLDYLPDIESSDSTPESLDMDNILECLFENCKIQQDTSDEIPKAVTRIFMIYGRSTCNINIKDSGNQLLAKMLSLPHVFFDVLHLINGDACNQNTRDFFDELATHGNSCVLNVEDFPLQLFNCTAKLLAHPLQRCIPVIPFVL